MSKNDLLKKIIPQNYDYLWTDHGVDYIFASCYLFKRFRNADIVLVYDHQENGLRFYLNKKERKKMARTGVKFYSHLPAVWKKNVCRYIRQGEKMLVETEKHKKIIKKISNKELGKYFLLRAQLFQALGNEYFFTEFFFLDLVEKLAKIQSEKGIVLCNNIAAVAKLKLEARELLNNFYNYNKVFKIYVSELGRRLRRKDLRWLGFEEVYKLSQGKLISVSRLDKCDWLLSKYNNWQVVVGAGVAGIKKKFEDCSLSHDLKEFKGQVANAGKYIGVVKIIPTFFSDQIARELSRIEKGDILVTETTGPEMMVACRKAGAIITDQGGITSHAAIVSREFGIPCIIGTKVASKILKDGDRVEVDAFKGIVKKL